MTIKTVARVQDELFETMVQGKRTWYINVTFLDRDSGSIGKQDYDKALELQGLLLELNGKEADFILEPKGEQNIQGGDKFKIKGFGTPGGAAIYTAPGIQGDGASPRGQTSGARGARSPEHDQDRNPSIRAAVALKAAASFLSMSAVSQEKVLEVAEFFEEWLQRKASDSVTTSGSATTSEPASSAYKNDLSVVTPPAGAGSEQSSGLGMAAPVAADSSRDQFGQPGPLPQETRPLPADSPDSHTTEPGSAEEGAFGEGVPSPPHVHDYQLRQGVRGFLVCKCGKTTKKATA